MNYKETILIVDDEKTNIDIIANSLNNSYNIKTAANGKVALDILTKFTIDLVITDMDMPIMNGIELIKKIKELKLKTDIIVISAHSNSDYLLNAINEGVNKYILKPINKRNLISNVQKTLNYRRLTEERKIFNKIINENVYYSKLDLNGKILEVSDALIEFTGYDKEEYLEKNITSLNPEFYDKKQIDEIWETILKDEEYKAEQIGKTKQGKPFTVKISVSPLYYYDTKVGYMVIKTDITLEKEFERLSIKDSLTNAYNRRYFNEKLEEYLSISKRDNRRASFLMFDIDYFKLYNDNYGHLKGDEVLKKISNAVQKTLKRPDDLFFRLGGEEFGILFKSDDNITAIKFAEIIKKSIDELEIEHKFSKISNYVTVSIGLYTALRDDNINTDKIYQLVDDLLYEAKHKGRNTIVHNI